MKKTGRHTRIALVTSVMLASLAVSGCGVDGVEFNGAVFDYMGLSNKNAQAQKEPKLPPRPGIVLPPQPDRLPEPGATEVAAPQGEAWPVDPEQSKVAAAEELDRKHEAFCQDALWRARAQGRTDVQINGPKGSCNPSILRNLTGKDISPR
jgi:hypothetical protein